MSWYRRYKALYDFEARNSTELTMHCDHTLLVERLADGSWPPAEKWMQGYNEVTLESGEFPGGAYVELVDEFVVEPKARSPPPEVEPRSQVPSLPPQPSPRHYSGKGFPMPGMAMTQGYGTQQENSVDSTGTVSPERKEEEEEAPPPPPRRSGLPSRGSENHVASLQGNQPPQAPPRPMPRKRSTDSVRDQKEALASPVTSPTHGALVEDSHRWSKVTFSIPVVCTACE